MDKMMPTRRNQQKEATKNLILDIATQQFAEQGFYKTTIRSIAKQAGIASGTIFVHFADKSALLAAAFHDIIAQQTEAAFATMPPSAPIVAKLLHLARQLYVYYAIDPTLSRTLLKETLFMSGEWGDVHKQQAQAFVVAVSVLLQEAQTSGELNANANCMTLATGFFAHYLFVLIAGLRESVFEPTIQIEMLTHLLDSLFDGAIL